MTLTLPWRRAEPLPVRYLTAEEAKAEEEREYAAHIEWERPVSDVHLAPLKPKWTKDVPTHAGVWWVRSPGYASKVVQVYADGGRLHYSWTDVEPAPVLRDGVLEWSNRPIAEPT